MIGMNTGNVSPVAQSDAFSFLLITHVQSSAAETPFGGIKESGYGKESGKDVAIAEYMVCIRCSISRVRKGYSIY
jgi:acyl-CoA reductase-like NAD-dependent aldehyde dehydrogenase